MQKFFEVVPSRAQSGLTFGVVGYSTRALVQAATDLGHAAIAIDAFGDQDTVDIAEAVHVVRDWPGGIASAASLCQVDAWLLGGGMENCYPLLQSTDPSNIGSTDCIAELAQLAPVLGPDRHQMSLLRSPLFCQRLCVDGIEWPETTFIKPKGNLTEWLLKPIRSAGGLHIRAAHFDPISSPQDHANAALNGLACYWQRRLVGRVLGATWVIDSKSCRLIGITQSLSDRDWPGPSEFIYRGSMGPIALQQQQRIALHHLGQRIVAELPDYRGYLQADLIEDSAGRLSLIEFNPRWTAGMEVLHELSNSPEQTPLGEHLQAWGIPLAPMHWDKPETRLVSKAIYYAAREVELTLATRRYLQSLRRWRDSKFPGSQWCLADLPPVANLAPMRFEKGTPILTLKSRSSARS